MVEVIVALVVFAVVAMGLLTSVAKSLALVRDNRARVVAANLAASEMDTVRSLSYDQLVTASRTQTVRSLTYTILRSVTPVFASGTGSACSGGTGTREVYRRVSVRVTFATMANTQPVRSDTIVRAPVTSAGSTTGAIGASVLDRNGQPVENATVTVTSGGGPVTGYTDESGCAYFADLATGNLTVTAARSGFVGTSGAATVSTVVGVTAGVISAPQFQLDAATSVAVRVAVLAADGTELTGYGFPKLGGTTGVVPVLDNPDRTLVGRTTLTGPTTTAAATWNVSAFPFTSGYEAHLGACGTGLPTTTQPGVSTQVTLGLGPVDLQLTPGSGLATLAGRTVQATAAGTPACTETYTSATTTATDGTLPLALPYGTWTLSVLGETSPATVTVTLAPGNPPAPVSIAVKK